MQSWNAVVITSADARQGYPVETANPAFCHMTGYTLDELKGQSLKRLQGPETDPQVLSHLRACLAEQRYFEGTTVNYRKDGSRYFVRWNISPVRDEHGVLTNYVSVQQDMSDQIHADLRNRLLAQALDTSSDPILLTDLDSNIIFANQAFAKITGYGVDDLIGKTPALFSSGQHDASFYASMYETLLKGDSFRATFVNRNKDGALFYVEQSITPIKGDSGHTSHYVSVSKDITDLIRREQTLREAATRDQMTGLHNRHYGEQQLERLSQSASPSATPTSIILCDVDHFKAINDRFGHPTGDRVLKDIAHLLRLHVRGGDALIRWGGEEFLILLENCSPPQAADLAERIRQRVEEHRDAEVGSVTLSLGIATLGEAEPIASLVARADAALYDAKRGGRNRVSRSDPLQAPQKTSPPTIAQARDR